MVSFSIFRQTKSGNHIDSFSVSHQRVNIVNLSASMTKHNLLTNRHLKIANERG